ncbi:MAG: exo-alpha-sialidase [Proteobacteria bacterium]|nr:exo-alpha-sialidase [Pseudomonadota bacterium]
MTKPNLPTRALPRFLIAMIMATLAGCGGSGGSVSIGDGGGGTPPPPPPPPPIANTLYLVSGPTPFVNGCDGNPSNGTLYINSKVEPYVAVDPLNMNHLVGVWQQDRWSGGGSRGLMSAASFDAGKSWARTPLPFSLCGGGTIANGGDYPIVSDPWVSIGPTGIVFASGLSFGAAVPGGTNSAILASRSLDGGKTWQNPSTLIVDGAAYSNDKDSITADPTNQNLVYAVWDRGPANTNEAPATFARSTDAGTTWAPAQTIFDPGANAQTLGNEIVVLPNGTLVDLFTQINYLPNNQQSAEAMIVRSTDQGATWSGAIKVADLFAVGARDPQTGAPVRDGADLPQMAVAPNGTLFVTWADGRFSNGARDSIALTMSPDGGSTWAAPTAINPADPAEAFEPSIHVRPDGTITVTYYDFRYDTGNPNTLPTVLWLTRSTDAANWTENAVAGPFDLDIAPNARGLFLGDYQGLTSIGNITEPFFVMTNNGNLNNRTDVFSAPQTIVAFMLSLMTRTPTVAAQHAPTQPPSAALLQKVSANLAQVTQRRDAAIHRNTPTNQGTPAPRFIP